LAKTSFREISQLLGWTPYGFWGAIAILSIDPIRLCFGSGLLPLMDVGQGGNLLERVVMIRRNIALELGAITPMIRLQDDIQLKYNQYVIFIRGVEVAGGKIELEDETTDHSATIVNHLTKIIEKHLHELLSREDVHILIDNISERHPTLVNELIPEHMSIGDVQRILVKLLKEGVSIRDLVLILETVANYAPITKDTDMLVEYVRANLRRTITQKFLSAEQNTVITLCPKLEQMLTAKIQKTEVGSYVNIDQEVSQQIFDSLKMEVGKLTDLGVLPIILTSPFVRMYFKQLVDEIHPGLVVISYGEIDQSAQVMSVGMVEL